MEAPAQACDEAHIFEHDDVVGEDYDYGYHQDDEGYELFDDAPRGAGEGQHPDHQATEDVEEGQASRLPTIAWRQRVSGAGDGAEVRRPDHGREQAEAQAHRHRHTQRRSEVEAGYVIVLDELPALEVRLEEGGPR